MYDVWGKVYCDGLSGFERTLNSGTDAVYTINGRYGVCNAITRNIRYNTYEHPEYELVAELQGHYYGSTFLNIKFLEIISKNIRYIYPKSIHSATLHGAYILNPCVVFSKHSLIRSFPHIGLSKWHYMTKIDRILSWIHVYGGKYFNDICLTNGPIYYSGNIAVSEWLPLDNGRSIQSNEITRRLGHNYTIQQLLDMRY